MWIRAFFIFFLRKIVVIIWHLIKLALKEKQNKNLLESKQLLLRVNQDLDFFFLNVLLGVFKSFPP